MGLRMSGKKQTHLQKACQSTEVRSITQIIDDGDEREKGEGKRQLRGVMLVSLGLRPM